MTIVILHPNVVYCATLGSVVAATFPGIPFTIVQRVGEAREAINSAPTEPLSLLSLEADDGDGLDYIPEFAAARKASRLAILTGRRERRDARMFRRIGCAGWIDELHADEAELQLALREMHAGRRYISPSVAAWLNDTIADGDSAHLTAREEAVLSLLGKGLDDGQVAARLCVSVSTVRTHRRRIVRVLGLRDQAALMRYAAMEGYMRISPEQEPDRR